MESAAHQSLNRGKGVIPHDMPSAFMERRDRERADMRQMTGDGPIGNQVNTERVHQFFSLPYYREILTDNPEARSYELRRS